ncbi:MAG: hypothetical protein R2730_09790 [Chitinophagales bacterium]
MDSILIFWRNQLVGTMINIVPDMWYLEGDWISNKSAFADEFEARLTNLEFKKVLKDPTISTRIEFQSYGQNERKSIAIIMGIIDNVLCIRRIANKEAIDWIVKNVPE